MGVIANPHAQSHRHRHAAAVAATAGAATDDPSSLLMME
jgi:hypothetical protein